MGGRKEKSGWRKNGYGEEQMMRGGGRLRSQTGVQPNSPGAGDRRREEAQMNGTLIGARR